MPPDDDAQHYGGQPAPQPAAPKKTYRRVRANSNSHPPSMVFSDTSTTRNTHVNRPPRVVNQDWREAVAAVDAEAHSDTEGDVEAARIKLRRAHADGSSAKPRTASGPQLLAATSSLTELPSSSPPKPFSQHSESHTPRPATTVSEVADSSRSAKLHEEVVAKLAQDNNVDSATGLHNHDTEATHDVAPHASEITQPATGKASSSEPKEYRDRALSYWNPKSSAVPRAQQNEDPVQTSPEDIQQFTPSSDPTGPRSAHATGHVWATSSPTPTPQHRDRKSKAAVAAWDHEEADGEDTLEEAMAMAAAADNKRILDTRKAKLEKIKREAASRAAPHGGDVKDDLVVLPDNSHDKALKPGKQERRQADQLKRTPFDFGRRGKRHDNLVTETHLNFAARKFNHSNQKNTNSGSTPAGQKSYYENSISHIQVNQALSADHQRQAKALRQGKERIHGKTPALPPRELSNSDFTLTEVDLDEPSISQHDSEDSEDDSEFEPEDDNRQDIDTYTESSPQQPALHAQASVEEGDYQDNETQVLGQSLHSDEEEEARPAARSRRVKRYAIGSDDEDELTPKAVEPAFPKPGSPSSPTFSLPGFGSSNGGFSQLFAETQVAEGDTETDGWAALRNQEAQGLLPTAMMLPAVVISESQKKRDNALIAAEFEDAESELVVAGPVKQYLNSQGFFTQSRPSDYLTQEASHATHVESGGTLRTQESTLVSSSLAALEPHTRKSALSPTQEDGDDTNMRLRRLRRRSSTSPPESRTSAPESPTFPPEIASGRSAVPPNAFDKLKEGARHIRHAQGLHAEHQKKTFMDDQAEESDEDMFGFQAKGDDDDDEDMEADGDGYVPNLVDDSKIDEDDKTQQDSLVTEKHREIAAADDVAHEAKLKKITEGYLRQKRRTEFLSDGEEDERKPVTRKKLRQIRSFEQSMGNTAFEESYTKDLDRDNDFEEAPTSPTGPTSPEQTLSTSERNALLRKRIELNAPATTMPLLGQEETEKRSEYNIARSARRVAEGSDDEEPQEFKKPTVARPSRSKQHFSEFLSRESGKQRGDGGSSAGASVVRPLSTVTKPTGRPGVSARSDFRRSHQLQSIKNGSIPLEKSTSFH